jgi:segregation and condensation protein B
VSCVHAVNKLVEYNLIQEVGRLDAVGRPILFGTTEDFLRCFGVSSMDELPVITPDKIEDFKKEAMEEVNIKVET